MDPKECRCDRFDHRRSSVTRLEWLETRGLSRVTVPVTAKTEDVLLTTTPTSGPNIKAECRSSRSEAVVECNQRAMLRAFATPHECGGKLCCVARPKTV